jgi:hypothetical protein
MSIGNYLYFCFYRSVFKICQCLTATYCPQTCPRVQFTQDGGNKLPAKVFDSNFSFACLQVGESTMANKDGFRLERICVGIREKVVRFEIVHAMGFKFQQKCTQISL